MYDGCTPGRDLDRLVKIKPTVGNSGSGVGSGVLMRKSYLMIILMGHATSNSETDNFGNIGLEWHSR